MSDGDSHAAEDQRWRLLGAAADVFSESGYKGVTSRKVSRRAGVSPSSFYEQFDDVDDCLLAAHDIAADCIWELVSAACAGAADWAERPRAALDAVVAFLVAEPSLGRLLGSDLAAGVPAVARARERLLLGLAGLLCPGPKLRLDTADRLAAEFEIHLTAGAAAQLGDRIVVGEVGRLPGLKPELAELLSWPYTGSLSAA